MGAYSTRTLTREEAIKMILDLLDGASNCEVAEALFGLTQDHVCDNYSLTGEEPDQSNRNGAVWEITG